MRLLLTFVRAYPWQSVLMLIALLVAGIADGISVSALLPLLSLALDGSTGADASLVASSTDTKDSLRAVVTAILHTIGLSPTLAGLLTLIVAAIVVKSLLLLFAQQRVGYTAAQVTTELRVALLRAMMASRWAYFVRQPVGGLANAMANEPMRSARAYVNSITVITLLIQTGIYTTVALLVSWRATLFSLCAGALILAAAHFLVAMSRRAGKRQTRLIKSLSTRLTDTLQSVKPLKAMAREHLADAVIAADARMLHTALQRAVFSKAALNAAQEPMFAVVLSCGVFVALVYWHVSFATLLVLFLLFVRILTCLGQVQKEFQNMVTEESAFWSLRRTIEEAERSAEQTYPGCAVDLTSSIRLDHVEVAYEDKFVLAGLSLEIPAGRLTALIGPSGAGKTTVVDLVTGLVRPQSGEVYIEQIPMASLDLRHWRGQIGYVPQDTLLLHDTILVNVTLGDPDLSTDDVVYALHAAGAWEFVQHMPEGTNTVVGERGMRLSGGQRQRIMIARALVHRPSLLILDEATTSLDPHTEAAICATLQQLVGDMTILAVSHQSAILNVANRVYRIEDGQAVLLADDLRSCMQSSSVAHAKSG